MSIFYIYTLLQNYILKLKVSFEKCLFWGNILTVFYKGVNFLCNSLRMVNIHLCLLLGNLHTNNCKNEFNDTSTPHLSPLTLEVVGAPQMTLQQYLSILPCLPLPSGNLQTPFPSIHWCYHPISSSVFLSFLLLSLSLAELFSPRQRILRCGHTIWVSVSLPWLGDHHALQLHSGFCCETPRSSHGLCRKCSEVSYSISSQGLESFSQFLLSRSSSHRHNGS